MDNDNNKMPYDDGNSQQFPENTFIPDNNPENTFIPNNNPDMYGQNVNNGFCQQDNMQNFPNNQFNPYQQPNNINQPYIRQYADAPKKKTPAKIYIILIAVIIFFAVVILAMSIIMKMMVEKKNDDLKGGVTLSESSYEDEEEDTEDDEEYIEDDEEYIDEEPETFPEEEEEEEEPEIITIAVENNEEPVPVNNDVTIDMDRTYQGSIVTQNGDLDIREEPDENSAVVTSIPEGTEVSFHRTNYNDWYWLSYNGKSGYVQRLYVSSFITFPDGNQAQDYVSPFISSTAIVATEKDPLNLRKSASMSGAIITAIPKGSTVTIIEFGDEWCYVSWGGYKGYASTQYLSY